MLAALACRGDESTLSGRVELVGNSTAAKDASAVAVWLVPISNPGVTLAAKNAQPPPRLVQMEKRFEPHIVIVPVGGAVEFPNKDPFFHNVFSLFEGKRFDLGLYEAGSTRTVHFDKPGISYIFCNIHPQMSAVVISLTTPYYAVTNRHGDISIPDVPPGRYILNVWFEGALPEELKSVSREVNVSQTDHSLGTIRLRASSHLQMGHMNKYGKVYDDPEPKTPGYAR